MRAYTRERQFALHRIEFLGKRPAMIFLRAFRQSHQIARLEPPVRRCQHARTRHVVRRDRNQPQIRQQIPHNRARKYRKSLDDERNGAPPQRFEQFVAMRVLAIQHRKIAPGIPRPVQPLDF